MLFLTMAIFTTAKILNHYIPSIHFQYLIVTTVILTFIFCIFIPNWSELEEIFRWSSLWNLYVFFTTPLLLIFLGLRAKGKRLSTIFDFVYTLL